MTDIRGSEEQGATFVELFFDLVFVFAVTQVTAVLAEDLTWPGVVRASIVFWLVWWAWTQYTWSLNEADTEHASIRLITLVATGLAFLMAVTVPLIAGPWGWLFPVSYLLLRTVGIGLQWRLASGDSVWTGSVRIWTVMSGLGLVAVVVSAFLPEDLRYAGLAVAALLDVIAALRAGRNEWRLFPGHFAERHGLFVIIVLGESLIAAGLTATAQPLDEGLLVVTVTAMTASCALWWTYFGWVKDALEAGLRSQPPATLGRYARDVYSFAHFPLIFGVIGFAVAIEEALSHPKEPMPAAVVVALCLGVALILGGTGLALRLARVPVPLIRWLVVAGLIGAIALLGYPPAWISLTVVAVLIGVVAILEPGRRAAPEGA